MAIAVHAETIANQLLLDQRGNAINPAAGGEARGEVVEGARRSEASED